MHHHVAALIDVISRTYGQDIAQYDDAFLAQSLDKRLAATGCPTAAVYLARLAGDEAEAAAFVRSLKITYSEFFRQPVAFALLESRLLPALAQERAGRSEVRVWSAGCAGGQEAYSIAILLDELAAVRGGTLPYRIFASDIEAEALQAARQGVYAAGAIQNVRLRHLQHHFTTHGDTYHVIPRVRERVDVSVYDLLDPDSSCPPVSIFGEFDLIFCANLLFYYRPAVRKLILDKLTGCLAANGFLVTDAAEQDGMVRSAGLARVNLPAQVFQRGAPGGQA